MYKIDAHNHPNYMGNDWRAIIRNMDECGIARTCLLAWEAPLDENPARNLEATTGALFGDTVIPFAQCLEVYEHCPDRFLLGYAPDPRRPHAMERLKAAVKIYGVRMCGEVKLRMMYNDPDAIDLFRLAGELGLPVTLHYDYPEAQLAPAGSPRRHYWFGGGIDDLERLLAACPNTNFLGHAPGFWCHISGDDKGLTSAYPQGPVLPGGAIERLLDKYPNLYCDCSAGSCINALRRDTDYTKRLMLAHPDRFIYARDMYTDDHARFMDSLGLPAEFMEGFYHGNIERLLSAGG